MQKLCFGAVQLARPMTETPKGLVGHFWITEPDLEKTRMARQARTADGVAYATMRWTSDGDRFDCLTARGPMDSGNFLESALTIAALAPMSWTQKSAFLKAISRMYQNVDRFHLKAVMKSPEPDQQAKAILGQNGLLNAIDNASQAGITLGLPEDTVLEMLYEQHFDGKQGSDIRNILMPHLKASALRVFHHAKNVTDSTLQETKRDAMIRAYRLLLEADTTDSYPDEVEALLTAWQTMPPTNIPSK